MYIIKHCSGFLIIRNTPWARNFIRRWWTVADRNVKCDQDAFDMLYRDVRHNNLYPLQLYLTLNLLYILYFNI
jgi:hypothetical protein